MRNSTKTRLISATALLAALSAPAQVSAFFWSGPGCFITNMLGRGNLTGDLHFSMGLGSYGVGRGLGYGYPYAYPLPGAPPHPYAHSAPLISPAAELPARSAGNAREIFEGNVWSERTTDLQLPEAGDRNVAPPNQWRHRR